MFRSFSRVAAAALSLRFVLLARRAALVAAATALAQANVAHARELSLSARDGTTISAELFEPGVQAGAAQAGRGTLLLFHMAGSNRGEYTPVIAPLTAQGFRVISIDQRSGGDGFGRSNETVRRRGASGGYLEALPDLEAALAYALTLAPGRPVIAVGSSYSAALVFLLAARHPGDVSALAAFSPGEYLGGPHSVRDAASRISIPVFATSSSSRSEVEAARDILAASPAAIKVQMVPKAGVHGASSLRADINPAGAAEVTTAFVAFLDRVAPR